MDFKELYKTKEYDFLRDNPRLGNRIILLGVTGSHGYGTEREGRDVDFRGITLELPSDLIGFKLFDGSDNDLNDNLLAEINTLVDKKKETKEKDLNDHIPAIINFISTELDKQKAIADKMEYESKLDFTNINKLFRKLISHYKYLYGIYYRPDMTKEETEEALKKLFRDEINVKDEISRFKGLPCARYDSKTKRSYILYPDGRREY